jgi:hypothetical protein
MESFFWLSTKTRSRAEEAPDLIINSTITRHHVGRLRADRPLAQEGARR